MELVSESHTLYVKYFLLRHLPDINDCDPDRCLNGGTCVDGQNNYTCMCVEGFGDDNCTTSKRCSCFPLCKDESAIVLCLILNRVLV